MDYFALVTGIVGLLGFFIQIKDMFPQHRESRIKIVCFSGGIAVGAILGLFRSVNFSFSVSLHPFSMLLLFASLCCLIFSMVCSTILLQERNTDRIKHLCSLTFNSSITFVGSLFLLAFSFAVSAKTSQSNSAWARLTRQEVMDLAKINEDNSNFQRAIEFLKYAKRLENADSELLTFLTPDKSSVIDDKIVSLEQENEKRLLANVKN